MQISDLELWDIFQKNFLVDKFDRNILVEKWWKIFGEKLLVKNIWWKIFSGILLVGNIWKNGRGPVD